MPDYAPLFHWVRAREAIRVARAAGTPPPWTADPILANYRFCNVRREDDTVTRWIAEHIRRRFANHPNLWLMLCIARQVNWPDTLAELIATPGAWPIGEEFDALELARALQARANRDEKVWTGAYVIAAGSIKGVPKSEHVALEVIEPLWTDRRRFAEIFETPNLEKTHALLSSYSGWGPFMAYQAMVDMRFTHILAAAPDVGTWAAAGPGTIRGLNRLYGRPLKAQPSQTQALDEIRAIDAVVRGETGVEMDFSDIPNILCETDKYLRVQNGEGTPRAKYVPRMADLFA